MPTYTYECEKCGHGFEMEQKITDPPRRRCPRCRGKVYRVIHPVGHILKGSGFYRTDYRDESYIDREKKEKEKVETGKKTCGQNCDSCPAAED